MDDRNLTAVAEQAAATSKVKRMALEGCTILFDDGHVSMGCRLEFDDASLDQDAVSNALAAGRVNGSYRPLRIGMYSPVDGWPYPSKTALAQVSECAVGEVTFILSSGSGDRKIITLSELLAQ
ncbi:MAG: hypothetical protein QGF46_02770 [Planctomycetota bacterium]|jgi:hypothetical protein|nr:hypothetical protein [Planctomycetota bacterium]